MHGNHQVKLLISLVVATLFMQYSQDRVYTKWNGGPISTLGRYKIKNSRMEISVFKIDNGILAYKMTYADSLILIESKERASIFQGWLLYWEKKNGRLWVQSSDIDIFLWDSMNDTNSYKEITITQSEKDLIKKIPGEFYDLMPDLDKKFCNENGYHR